MKNRRKDKIIYKVTNSLNGKMYIGFCVDFKERKARHLKCAEKGIVTKFYNAIRKYGKDNFIWEIVEKDIESLDKLKEREIHYIKLLDTYNTGYNSTLGGDGGFTGHNSGQFKKGMKPWSTGIKMTEEYIEKLRISHRGLKQPYSQIEKRVNSFFKKVIQMNLEGLELKEFNSIKEAANGKSSLQAAISCVCNNKYGYKSAGGYKWKFKNN